MDLGTLPSMDTEDERIDTEPAGEFLRRETKALLPFFLSTACACCLVAVGGCCTRVSIEYREPIQKLVKALAHFIG